MSKLTKEGASPHPPEQTFKLEAQAPLWNRTIKFPSIQSITTLQIQIKDYVSTNLAKGRITPILGYLTEDANGASFHMTQYPDYREDRLPMLEEETNTIVAEELATILGGEVIPSVIPNRKYPLMATVGTRQGYGKRSFIHSREEAHDLFTTTSILDAHMISVRPKYDDTDSERNIVLEEYDEPVILVLGGIEIFPKIRKAAYQLGQWNIPVENFATGIISMYSTKLAEEE